MRKRESDGVRLHRLKREYQIQMSMRDRLANELVTVDARLARLTVEMDDLSERIAAARTQAAEAVGEVTE